MGKPEKKVCTNYEGMELTEKHKKMMAYNECHDDFNTWFKSDEFLGALGKASQRGIKAYMDTLADGEPFQLGEVVDASVVGIQYMLGGDDGSK